MTRSFTNTSPNAPPAEPRLAAVVLICTIVLGFRLVAWLKPSSFIAIPDSLALPITLLGVVYLLSGVYAWRKNPSSLTRVFLLSGIGGGIHWGGSIGAMGAGGGIAFLVFYLAVTAMGDAAFLDLALRYPRQVQRQGVRAWGLYVPAILTLAAVPIAPFLPKTTIESGIGFVLGVAFLMSIAGGVVFLVKWFRATRAERRGQYLTPIVAAIVLTSVLDLLADEGVLPGLPEAWTLPYVFVPLVFAWALTRLPAGADTTDSA